MGWFITQSLLFIIITAIIFFLIGLWVGWILWARRNKTTGKHSAETAERKPAPASAAAAGAAPGSPDDGGTAGAEGDEAENDDATAGEKTSAGTVAATTPAETATALAVPSAGLTDGTTDETAAADRVAAPSGETAGKPAAEPSDIDDENLAVFAGAEAEVVAEAEAATREAAVGSETGTGGETGADTTDGADGTAAAAVVGSGEKDGEDEPDDDLTRLEGVGPKISAALKAAGYGSYAKVADATEEDLRKALAEAGITFSPAAASFAAQAQYLVVGDEEGLEEYQDYLIAGRERRSTEFVEDVDYTDVDEVEGEAAKQAALETDAAKVAEATGDEVDADAVADDAAAADAVGGDAAAADAVADDAAEPEAPADENLKVIEGIGPKIEKALKAAGITSYAQIAAASETELREYIARSGIKFAPSVKTWAHQAQYLVDGNDDGLNEYQDYLIGGQERGTKFVEDVDYTDVDRIEDTSRKQAALEADAAKVAEVEGRTA